VIVAAPRRVPVMALVPKPLRVPAPARKKKVASDGSDCAESERNEKRRSDDARRKRSGGDVTKAATTVLATTIVLLASDTNAKPVPRKSKTALHG